MKYDDFIISDYFGGEIYWFRASKINKGVCVGKPPTTIEENNKALKELGFTDEQIESRLKVLRGGEWSEI